MFFGFVGFAAAVTVAVLVRPIASQALSLFGLALFAETPLGIIVLIVFFTTIEILIYTLFQWRRPDPAGLTGALVVAGLLRFVDYMILAPTAANNDSVSQGLTAVYAILEVTTYAFIANRRKPITA